MKHFKIATTLYFFLVLIANTPDAAPTPSHCSSELSSDSSSQPEPAEAVVGMADLHAHVFGEAAFSGRWHWGSVEGSSETALKACDGDAETHAGAKGWFMEDRFGEIKGPITGSVTHGDTGDHRGRRGHPKYEDWPRWDSVAHQRYWEKDIKKAFDGGVKLMVVQATDSLAMCQLVKKGVPNSPKPKDRIYDCDWGDSYKSLVRQVRLAHEFAKRTSWVTIASTPKDARKIINRGEMAWVLGIEADYAWGSESAGIDLKKRFANYYKEGVRAFYISHQLNTRLAGAAIYYQPMKTLQWIANCFFLNEGCNSTKHDRPPYKIEIKHPGCFRWWPWRDPFVDDYAAICELEYKAWIDGKNNKNGFANYPNGGVYTENGVEKNKLGLTLEGKTIVEAMMDKGVLIDIGHISEQAIDDVKRISTAHGGYPVYASHGFFRDRMLKKSDPYGDLLYNSSHELTISASTVRLIRDTGGMVGHFLEPVPQTTYSESRVENSCHGSTRSLAQGLAWGVDQGVKLAVATDFMGMARGLTPRGKGHGQCLGKKEHQDAQTVEGGDRVFNKMGLAHVGLLPSMLKDLEVIGLEQKYVRHVRDESAENFIRMWERAENKK